MTVFIAALFLGGGFLLGVRWKYRHYNAWVAEHEEAYQQLNRLHDQACNGWRQADDALQRLQIQYDALAERHGERVP